MTTILYDNHIHHAPMNFSSIIIAEIAVCGAGLFFLLPSDQVLQSWRLAPKSWGALVNEQRYARRDGPMEYIMTGPVDLAIDGNPCG